MELQLDNNCEIIEPRFHDGSVVSLDTSDDKCAIIGLQTVDGTPHTLTLPGLLGILCTDFRAGNIILSAQIFTKTSPPERFVRIAYGIDDGGHDAHVRSIFERIEHGDLTLFSILPSYGCELHAVCGSVALQRDEKP